MPFEINPTKIRLMFTQTAIISLGRRYFWPAAASLWTAIYVDHRWCLFYFIFLVQLSGVLLREFSWLLGRSRFRLLSAEGRIIHFASIELDSGGYHDSRASEYSQLTRTDCINGISHLQVFWWLASFWSSFFVETTFSLSAIFPRSRVPFFLLLPVLSR